MGFSRLDTEDETTQLITVIRHLRTVHSTKRLSRSLPSIPARYTVVPYPLSYRCCLQIGIPGLLAEFDEIKKQTQAIGATPKVAFDTNPDKNRYKGTVMMSCE